jgi:hypothetical protein
MIHRKAAVTIAEWARTHVPLYRELYGSTPITTWPQFQELPPLTYTRLQATPLRDQVDDLRDVLRTYTPYALQSRVTPTAFVADKDDTDSIYDSVRRAFALAGVRAPARLLIVADPEQRYPAVEIADMLGYFRIEAHVLIGGDHGRVASAIDAFRPDRLAAFGASLPAAFVPDAAVRTPGAPRTDLYLVPEAGIVAVRRPGQSSYQLLSGYFGIETGPDRRLLLTALSRYHQPLIRYILADRGRLVRGRLLLDELAP